MSDDVVIVWCPDCQSYVDAEEAARDEQCPNCGITEGELAEVYG